MLKDFTLDPDDAGLRTAANMMVPSASPDRPNRSIRGAGIFNVWYKYSRGVCPYGDPQRHRVLKDFTLDPDDAGLRTAANMMVLPLFFLGSNMMVRPLFQEHDGTFHQPSRPEQIDSFVKQEYLTLGTNIVEYIDIYGTPSSF